MAIYTRNEQGNFVPFNFPSLKGDRGEQGLPGKNGKDGITPDIQIGTVTTLEPDQQAMVTKRGTKEHPIFDFGIPSIGANKRTLLIDYEHTSNKVVIPNSLNLETGIYSTLEPHGLRDGDGLLLSFNNNGYHKFNVKKIPKELWQFNWTTWYFPTVIVVSDTEFKLKYNSDNSEITYSTASSDNGELEFGEWGFEVAQNGITFTDGNFSKYKILTLEIYIPTISKGYSIKLDIFNKKLNENYGIGFPFIPEAYDQYVSDTYKNIVYKNNQYNIKFIIEENKVRQEATRTTYGVATNYRYMHPNLTKSDSSIFVHETYTDNVLFKDNIELLRRDDKFLNGTKIRIYGEGV